MTNPPTAGSSGFKEGPASESVISLSQAILAPLDALFKAQLHAARSFVSLLLQLSYPHQAVDDAGRPTGQGTPYYFEFPHDVTINDVPRRQVIRVPTLALVPVTPLSVETAEFTLDLAVKEIGRHQQLQASEQDAVDKERAAGFDTARRPWFLVSEPVSVRGTLAAPAGASAEAERQTTIHISVKLSRTPIPAGLDRLLTTLTQISEMR